MTERPHTGPLAGIRVMDISIMAAGPWAGALLGMLGAEVIKVEPPAGDGTRFVTPMQRGMGTSFIAMNVNKTGIKLDLKSAAGREQALQLAASCDVFLQNLRVGVMPRLGLDYEALKKINPRLVYCSVSGYGETGPLAKAGCADPIMQAYSGFARGNGAAGDDLEAFRFTGFLDLATAGLAAEAIMEAAERAIANKATRLCMDASMRGPSDKDVGSVAEAVRQVKSQYPQLELCACLGLLKDGQAETLEAAGVDAYNHNLNTSERHYGEICSTHGFTDRLDTVRKVREAGISSCSGEIGRAHV